MFLYQRHCDVHFPHLVYHDLVLDPCTNHAELSCPDHEVLCTLTDDALSYHELSRLPSPLPDFPTLALVEYNLIPYHPLVLPLLATFPPVPKVQLSGYACG